MPKTMVVGIRVPTNDIIKIDKLVSSGTFLNRADLIRCAIRRLLEEYK